MMNRELAQTISLSAVPRRSRWFGKGISRCLAGLEPGVVSRRRPVNWGNVLGLVTALAVMALGWTAVGIAVSHILR